MINIAGEIFGRLTVLEFVGREGNRYYWNCLCECGAEKKIDAYSLTSGATRSCGCFRDELARAMNTTHGHGTRESTGSGTFRTWEGAISRCHRETDPSYAHYGGRGIAVCERWRASFENFLSDMGERPEGKTIDRIDVDGDYEPSNCRWATTAEQARNRRDNVIVEMDGKSQCLADWARELGLSTSTVWSRLDRGWSAIDALTVPVDESRRRKA